MANDTEVDPCPPSLPYAEDYLPELSVVFIVLFAFAALATLIVLCLFLETSFFFWKHLNNWKPRDKAKWLVAVYPVMCITSCVALIVPRASTLNDLVASAYLSVCIYLFVTMLIGHYGGAKKMMKRLEGTQMKLNLPPVCCCCVCLPSPLLSYGRIQWLETMVLQYALFGPITSYVSAILWANDDFGYKQNAAASGSTWLHSINSATTLLAMYGFQIIYNVSQVPLSRTAVRPKFLCLQLVLFINGIQQSVIKLFVASGLIHCDPPLNPTGVADRYHHLIVIFEMFIINLVARKYYRRHVGNIPPEDAFRADTRDAGAETTNSLLREYPGMSYLPSPSSEGSRRSSVFTVGLPDFKNLFRRSKHPGDSISEASTSKPDSTIDATRSFFERQSMSSTVEMGTDPMVPYADQFRSRSLHKPAEHDAIRTRPEAYSYAGQTNYPVIREQPGRSTTTRTKVDSETTFEGASDVDEPVIDPSKIKLSIRDSTAV